MDVADRLGFLRAPDAKTAQIVSLSVGRLDLALSAATGWARPRGLGTHPSRHADATHCRR